MLPGRCVRVLFLFCFVYMSICCVSCLGWFSLSQVSEHCESTNLLTALPSSFLEPLLSFTLMEEPEIRLLVLSILTSLIDRHHNVARLINVRSECGRFFQSRGAPPNGSLWSLQQWSDSYLLIYSVTFDVSVLELKEDTCCHQDNLFIRKVSSFFIVLNNTFNKTPESYSSSLFPFHFWMCSMLSVSTDTSTWHVRRKAVGRVITWLSSPCWLSSVWNWPMTRFWWTWSDWSWPCRCSRWNVIIMICCLFVWRCNYPVFSVIGWSGAGIVQSWRSVNL